MVKVVIKGWNPGLRKVSLVNLLRAEVGYSLALAKQSVDQCLAGQELSVDLPSEAAAASFAHEASSLGAIAHVGDSARMTHPARER